MKLSKLSSSSSSWLLKLPITTLNHPRSRLIRLVPSHYSFVFGVREDWSLSWGARGVPWEGTFPRDPARLNLTSNLLSPPKHINSDWVRVWRLMHLSHVTTLKSVVAWTEDCACVWDTVESFIAFGYGTLRLKVSYGIRSPSVILSDMGVYGWEYLNHLTFTRELPK